MSKVITPHFEQLIDRFIASGRSIINLEVIRAGLRLLEEHEAKTARVTREHLSRVIEIALLDTRPLISASNSFVAGGDEKSARPLYHSGRGGPDQIEDYI